MKTKPDTPKKGYSSMYRIIGIEIRDFKRVRVARMKIDKTCGLVKIGGENGNGKTSILDAIESALKPPPRSLGNPTRDGGAAAGVRIQIPPYEVRRFWVEGKPALRVVSMDGKSEIKQPAEFLQDLMGRAFTDPFEFIGAQPIEQRRMLLDLLAIDTTDIDQRIDEAREERKRLERIQSDLEARFRQAKYVDGVPEEEQSVGELSVRLQEMLRINAENDAKRKDLQFKERAVSVERTAAERASQDVDDLKRRLALAEKARDEAQARCERLQADFDLESTKVKDLVDQDPTELQVAISNVEAVNNQVRANRAYHAAQDDWKAAEGNVKVQLEVETNLDKEKKWLLAEAQYPIDGLGFDAKQVTLNGHAFSEASDAEKLRAATAIGLARSGALKIIRIQNASLLDNHSLELMEQIAQEYDALVFVEIVANKNEDGSYDKEVDFLIEDGELVGGEA